MPEAAVHLYLRAGARSVAWRTHLRDGSISNAPFSKRHDPTFIESLDEALAELAVDVRIPAELAGRHSCVNPFGLQKLLDHFVSYEGDVEDFLPAPPESRDAYARLSRIMGLINTYLYPAFRPDTLIPLHALVVREWLQGYSLAAIIRERIKYNKRNGRSYQLPKLIRETMELVEQVARFRAPKYISAYMDVLKYHLV